MLSGLLLLRSRILTSVLDRAIDRDVVFGPDLYSDRAIDFNFVQNRALDLNRAIDRARDLSRALDLDRALDCALDLNLTLDRAIDYAVDLDVDRAWGLHRVGDISLTLDRVRDINRAVDLDSDPVRRAIDLTGEIDVAVERYLRSISRYDRIQPIVANACRLALGRAFSMAIGKALGSSRQPDSWNALLKFTQAFTDVTGLNTVGRQTAEPATLEVTLQESLTEQGDVPDEGPAGLSLRVPVAAERLRQRAGPVFARAERPTPESATIIRITALRLAAEADDLQRKDIGDMFRQVAAGITLLERRATGELQAPEVIMLAFDQPVSEVPEAARHRHGSGR